MISDAYYEPPEARLFANCDWCGDEIFEGDDYYELNGEKVCCECVSRCCREAEIEKPMRIPMRMEVE